MLLLPLGEMPIKTVIDLTMNVKQKKRKLGWTKTGIILPVRSHVLHFVDILMLVAVNRDFN